MKYATLSASVLGLSALAAHADTEITETAPPPQWTLEQPELMNVDGSDPGTSTDFVAAIERLSIKPTDTTSITLTCQTVRRNGELEDTRLNVGFDLDTNAEVFLSRMSVRKVSGKVRIGDDTKSYGFQWNVKTQAYVPFDRRLARRIFNAGVRGDEVAFIRSGDTKMSIDLPEMNEDFRTFARGCPALKQ